MVVQIFQETKHVLHRIRQCNGVFHSTLYAQASIVVTADEAKTKKTNNITDTLYTQASIASYHR